MNFVHLCASRVTRMYNKMKRLQFCVTTLQFFTRPNLYECVYARAHSYVCVCVYSCMCMRMSISLPLCSLFLLFCQQNINGSSCHIRENSQHEIFCRRRKQLNRFIRIFTSIACQTFHTLYAYSSSVSLAIFYSVRFTFGCWLWIFQPPSQSSFSLIFNFQ